MLLIHLYSEEYHPLLTQVLNPRQYFIPCLGLFIFLKGLFGESMPNFKWIIWILKSQTAHLPFCTAILGHFYLGFHWLLTQDTSTVFSAGRRLLRGQPCKRTVRLRTRVGLLHNYNGSSPVSNPETCCVHVRVCALARAQAHTWRTASISPQGHPRKRLEALLRQGFPRSQVCLQFLIILPATPHFISFLCFGPSDLWHLSSLNLLQLMLLRDLNHHLSGIKSL